MIPSLRPLYPSGRKKSKMSGKRAYWEASELCYNEENIMPTRKTGKIDPVQTIKVRIGEISVTKNRSSEPYIKSFIATPENVTQECLGTLVGVFSVSDHSDSSGFVVNVLVSAIRKEYFANPRRGAVESFEAALHRMNLALSELVKNGQTDWIGNLHGAVAAIEKHSVHFSVTGFGRILLFRGGMLSDIGDGLASEEAATHPMKTFVEISSGRINPDDCILLSSPEVSDLFSDAELERNARRLIPEQRFFRFLETAMTNELRQGAAIVLTAEEHAEESVAPKRPVRTPKPRTARIRNAFSAETFKQAAETRAEIFREEAPVVSDPPATDTRFGDIYIQGEELGDHEEHPTITKLRWIGEDMASSLRGLGKRIRENLRQRTETIAVVVSGSIASSLSKVRRSTKSVFPARSAAPKQPKSAAATTPHRPTEQEGKTSAPPKTDRKTVRMPDMPDIRIPSIPVGRAGRFVSALISDTVIPVSRRAVETTGIAIGTTARGTRRVFTSLKDRFFSLEPKRQLMIAASAAFICTIGGTMVWSSLTEEKEVPVPVVVTEVPVPSFPPENEPMASLASPESVTPAAEDIVAPIHLKDSLYLVTRSGVHDTGSGSFFPVPTGTDIRYATGMDDINVVFLMTETGRLLAFAPSNRSFTENVLRLPDGFRPADIGTFLTYLYVLEDGTGRIYRFPRAEGGFGDGLLWTKEPMDTGTTAIAVSENIYGTTASGIQAFLRGKPVAGFALETTATPLVIDAVCAHEEAPDRFATVDRNSKRIVVFGSDGHIIAQRFHESFGSASACSLSRDGNTIAVSIGKDASLIRLPQ